MAIVNLLNQTLVQIGRGPLRPSRLPGAKRVYQTAYEWLIPRYPFRKLLEIEGFYIYTSSLDTGVSWHLMNQGRIEGQTTELFKQDLKPGMVVVDLGANIGYFTLLSARLVGDSGSVFAFEPNRSYLQLLERSVEANGFKNVVPVPKAAFNKTGRFKIALTPDTRSRTMDAVSLDDFFSDWDRRIDFVKIDIDGGEPFALQGMRRVLQTNPQMKMIVEYDPGCLKRSGTSPAEFLDRFADFGLEIQAVYDEIRKFVGPPDRNLLLSVKDVVNLYLVRRTT